MDGDVKICEKIEILLVGSRQKITFFEFFWSCETNFYYEVWPALVIY